jgi:hypothetical protein
MSVPTITPLPIAPQVTDSPSVFSQRANTFVAALGTLVTETNASISEINTALAGALVTFAAFRGDWEAVTGGYDLGDVVREDGIFYISLAAANEDQPPDTTWQELQIADQIKYNAAGLTSVTATTVQGAIEQLSTLPTGAVKTANYTLQAADTGGMVRISAGNITVPAGVFSAGDVVVVYNDSTTTRTIIRDGGVTMFWVGGANANRTLIQRGLATIACVGSNTFVITGQGVQ